MSAEGGQLCLQQNQSINDFRSKYHKFYVSLFLIKGDATGPGRS